MPTNLEILRDKYDLATTGGEVVLVFMPRYALEAIKGTYHRLRYELPKIEDTDTRDEIEAWIDAGQFGLEDEMLVQDLLDQLVIMNEHLETMAENSAQVAAAMYTTSDNTPIADVIEGISAGTSAWDDLEIEDLITAVEVIGTALG